MFAELTLLHRGLRAGAYSTPPSQTPCALMKQIYRYKDRYIKRQIDRQIYKKMDRQIADRARPSQTPCALMRQIDRQIDIQLDNLELKINGQTIERIGEGCTQSSFKFVGIHLDEFLSWEPHLKHVRGKISSAYFALSRVKNLFPTTIIKTIYNSIFKSHLEYGLHTNPLFKSLRMLKVPDLIEYKSSCFMFNYVNKKCPSSFTDYFTHFRGENRSKNIIQRFLLNNHQPIFQHTVYQRYGTT